MVKDAQSIFPSTHSPHPSWPKQALMSELLEKITFRSSFRKKHLSTPNGVELFGHKAGFHGG